MEREIDGRVRGLKGKRGERQRREKGGRGRGEGRKGNEKISPSLRRTEYLRQLAASTDIHQQLLVLRSILVDHSIPRTSWPHISVFTACHTIFWL